MTIEPATISAKGEREATSPHQKEISLDTAKLTRAYEKYGYLVFRICREVLRQEEDAEDAMHEAFLKYWRYTEKLTEPKEIVGMLRRIALSTSIDLLRSRQRQGRYGEAWKDLHQLLQNEDNKAKENKESSKELVSILLRAVRVDQATLEMVYHYYLDEMTLKEVAQTTGYSRRSVAMKLQKFREYAAKYCLNHGITW